MKKLITKGVLSVLVVLITFFSIAPTYIHAGNANWWELDFKNFAGKVSTDPALGGSPANEIFGERYTFAQVSWILSSLIAIIGGDVAVCAAAASDIANASQKSAAIVDCLHQALADGSFNTGPVIGLAGGIETLYHIRPASGVDYIATQIQNWHIIPAAQAQGFGFTNSLVPMQKMWMLSRNAAYALSTLVILILAFMIMFRAKLNPQTSITVQSALPKLMIALVFITFSYAIAGLLVDLAFVVQGIIATLVSTGGIAGDQSFDVFRQMNNVVGNVLAYGIAFMADSLDGGIIANLIPDLGALNIIKGSLFVLDAPLALVVLLLLIIALAKIFWLLLLTYARIMFLVIAGPFIGLASVVSAQASIGSWIKNIIAQLAVFVTITLVVLFGHIVYYGFGNNIADNPVLQALNVLGVQIDPFGVDQVANKDGVGSRFLEDLAPQKSGNFPAGFNFGNNLRGLGFFLSLVLMLSASKLANSVRDQIQTGRATFGFAVGEAIAPIKPFGLYGAAEGMNIAQMGANKAGLPTPAWVQTGRKVLGIRG